MTQAVDADYLVVGAGAMGMAFTDALTGHAAAHVAVVDRRAGVGGHWREAYPFVRLHQSSSFYGVASTVLGGGRIQTSGPEAGLHERADQPTICAYYEDLLARMLASGRVDFFPRCDYQGERRFASLDTGQEFEVPQHCRIVDARYLAPDIPAETPPRFRVSDGARVIPVNDLPACDEDPSTYVVVGSGKTATDACVWLLTQRRVDPGAICWVRPREPWMLNRAVIQPDPVTYLGMVAHMMEAAGASPSLDNLFLRLEDAGTMVRIDRAVTPTMAKAPTLGGWELELLRSIENVVRLGHIRSAGPARLELADGTVTLADDALVVNCAADGLKNPPRVPIWGPEEITLQPIRAGFPCFGAALAGYVEATRDDDDVKNRLCPPSSYGNTLVQWATMNVLGMRATASFGSEPDIKQWSDRVALNPARVPPDHPGSAELDEVLDRLRTHVPAGVAQLARLCGQPAG
ncbi:pyridine nucleotide-disulfide oxidoreductase [Nocardioides guangzhouensis]|uniref:Pyridine nucleotide-disulfide oxidoreductase n=1 Tax=Nocardioides guangzhouensis TaxID=2497878 RepID=A0A4Q4ZDQ2_9ACTN|nr:NAD(P)-binding protein [Nocardioides guangzhouensis]RYP85868.1 pyridine nucleotide-disulfide oxidoreductase [Nocardioides guangzhouensis]